MRCLTLFSLAAIVFSFVCFADNAMAQGVSMASEEKLQLRGDYWFNELTAEVKVTDLLVPANPGTRLELFDMLGMDVHKETVIPVVLSYSRFGFRMEFWRNTYLGKKVMAQDINFNGIKYTLSTEVESQLVTDNYDMRVFLDLLGQKKLDLYPLAGIRYQRHEVSLIDTSGIIPPADKVLHAPMPYVGAGIRFNISPYISFGGELAGMNIQLSDYNLKLTGYTDFNAYIELRITPMFAIVGGYRSVNLLVDVKDDDYEYNFHSNMQGLFAGVSLSF